MGIGETLVLIAASVLALAGVAVGLAAAAVWLVARRVRRSHAVRRGTLLMRSVSAPNKATREIGRLRMTLFDSVTATGRVLREVEGPALMGDLARDLTRAAAVTDHRLALLATEPDVDLLARTLPALRTSVHNLARAAAEVRGSAWKFAAGIEQPRVQRLTLEVADQVAGLQLGLAEVQAIRVSAGL
jgi:hypothetical protein